MNSLKYISFSNLNISEAETVSRMLRSSSYDYVKYFSPFKFSSSTIRKILRLAKKDIFFTIKIHQNLPSQDQSAIVGFYMLRGLDEGYEDPMYGVFVDQAFSGKGIGRLTISHAESFCKLNNYERLLLKVNPANAAAYYLYKSHGFNILRKEETTSNIILCKALPVRI